MEMLHRRARRRVTVNVTQLPPCSTQRVFFSLPDLGDGFSLLSLSVSLWQIFTCSKVGLTSVRFSANTAQNATNGRTLPLTWPNACRMQILAVELVADTQIGRTINSGRSAERRFSAVRDAKRAKAVSHRSSA